MTETLLGKLDHEATFDCVQCGYCLPVCPTYIAFKKEKHSPRGRINLVKLAAEEKISIDDMQEGIDLCLGCRACETVCPTNVRYGDILMSAVKVLKENKEMGIVEKGIRTSTFKVALKNKKTLRLINKGMYVYNMTRLKNFVDKTNILKPLDKFNQLNRAMPDVILSRRITRSTNSFRRNDISVGFFQGCIMDSFFANVNNLAMKIMKENNVQVTNIPGQTCCGALQHHSGETEQTLELARKNIMEYEKYDFDYIVNTIGGCGATLKEYDKLFVPGTEWHSRAKNLQTRSEIFPK